MRLLIRAVVVTLGAIAAVLQFGVLIYFSFLVLTTLGMAGGGVTEQQSRMLWLLPLCTAAGAALSFRFLAVGGAIMIATAVGYHYFRVDYHQVVFGSAVPGLVGLISGFVLWLIKLLPRKS